jgi:hypothetical protein
MTFSRAEKAHKYWALALHSFGLMDDVLIEIEFSHTLFSGCTTLFR